MNGKGEEIEVPLIKLLDFSWDIFFESSSKESKGKRGLLHGRLKKFCKSVHHRRHSFPRFSNTNTNTDTDTNTSDQHHHHHHHHHRHGSISKLSAKKLFNLSSKKKGKNGEPTMDTNSEHDEVEEHKEKNDDEKEEEIDEQKEKDEHEKEKDGEEEEEAEEKEKEKEKRSDDKETKHEKKHKKWHFREKKSVKKNGDGCAIVAGVETVHT